MGGQGFLTGILLGAIVSGGSVHYYHKAQSVEPAAEKPPAPPPAKANRYDYDDILRNKGNVPVRLSPQEKPAAAAPNGSRSSPANKKSGADEKPTNKSGTSASAATEATIKQPPTKPKQAVGISPSEPAQAPKKKQNPPPTSQASFIVQVQTLPQLNAAQALQQRLKSLGYDSMIQTTQLRNGAGYLVWMGPFDRLRANSIQADLRQSAVASALIVPVNR